MNYLKIKCIRFLLLLLCAQILGLNANENITIKKFRGTEISPFIKDIVKLCDMIYKDAPYFYNGDDVEYTAYVESYTQANDAVICLAFDGREAIGLSIGIPLRQSRDFYFPTLIDHGYDIDTLFYLGEFGVKEGYRDAGIEEALYQQIEDSVKEQAQFSAVCVWEIGNIRDAFFEKHGFVRHPELNFDINWKNIGATEESPHHAVYSLKRL